MLKSASTIVAQTGRIRRSPNYSSKRRTTHDGRFICTPQAARCERETDLGRSMYRHRANKSSQTVEYETDRLRFLGRGRTAANPAIFERPYIAFQDDRPCPRSDLLPTTDSPSWSTAKAHVAFVTGAADNQRPSRQSPNNTRRSMRSSKHSPARSERYKRELR